MILKELLKNVYPDKIDSQFANLDINLILANSKETNEKTLFVAMKGQKGHGLDYIDEVIKNGCKVIAAEDFSSAKKIPGVLFLTVKDAKEFLNKIVREFYDKPDQKLNVVGITGTNGKTTITYLLEAVLKQNNVNCGVIGTINYRYLDKCFDSKNTTPGLIQNYQFLSELVQNNISHCIMEVSSHALDQGRVDTINFSAGIFTNLTVDHLDYHKDLENYFQAKLKLFKMLKKNALAIVNNDDPYAKRIIENTKAKIITYGIKIKSDVMAKEIKANPDGSIFNVVTKKSSFEIRTPLIGLHNIYNILAAVGYLLNAGIKPETIKEVLANFVGAPGRLERIDCGQKFYIFIDYAHTEDALRNILKALREVSDSKIILLFGCGGDRDRTKRPMMGKAACELADYSIVTSDNPRSEEPIKIIEEIIKGFNENNYEIVEKREEAIKKVLEIAQPGNIIVLAGKGHENYQIFKDKTIHFDEKEIIKKYIKC